MKYTKKAFSMIELIIAVSLLTLLSAIAVTSMGGAKDKSNNSKVVSDVKTLANAFRSYAEEQKSLPEPKGNLQYYGEDTGYRHDMTDAFGVSGFVSQEVLPAKYLNQFLLDPKTGQYYAYAKTKHTAHFEIAGITFENNIPKAIVTGNWPGDYGPYNLVKEYAGPNFVYELSEEYFPYNPNERMLVGKISSYTGGTLTINDKTYSESEILSYTLGQGDRVKITSGGSANIYFSDGSQTLLGEMGSDSEIELTQMKYREENNLFTSIKLSLNLGSLWAKASKMSDKSEFEVYTTDAVAAVRGTVFGVRKSGGSNIVVQQGKVEVNKKTDSSLMPINESILIAQGIITHDEGKTYIEVPSGSGSKGVGSVSEGAMNFSSSTGALTQLTPVMSGGVIENIAEINPNQQIELQLLQQTSPSIFQVELGLNKSFLYADYLKLTTSTGALYQSTNFWKTHTSGTLTLSGGTSFLTTRLRDIISSSPTIQLAFCNLKNGKERCSKELLLSIEDNLSFNIENKVATSCENDIDKIYNELFFKPVTQKICSQLLSIPGWSEKTIAEKEELIKQLMSGKFCDIYQKDHGTLSGTGYLNCKPNFSRLNGEKVENLLAGKGYELVAYAGYNIADNTELITPNGSISGNVADLAGVYNKYNSLSGVFYDNYSTQPSLTAAHLNSLGFDVSVQTGTDSSVYTWGKYGKGIMIDNNNNGTQDYIKYDITPLNLTGSFAIEMSVRGAALKRNSCLGIIGNCYNRYHLFELENKKIYLTSYNGTIVLGDRVSGFKDYLKIDNFSNLQDNSFYKVIASFNGDIWSLKIIGNGVDITGTQINSTYKVNLNTENITIGSRKESSNYDSQWNDIIDYVKIYQKPSVNLSDVRSILQFDDLTIQVARYIINTPVEK